MTMTEQRPPAAPDEDAQRPPEVTPVRLTPSQMRTFDQLLAIGGERPVASSTVIDRLTSIITEGTRDALERWTERSMWVGKSLVATAHRCEGQLLAERLAPRSSKMTSPTAMGIVTHRAIQIAHTHQGRAPEEYVRLAIAGACSEEDFSEFWDAAEEHIQSDLQVSATSRVVGFLDAFPPIAANWVPRFEENIQAKLGRLTLSARPDLLLGRPRADGRQTMFICDVKSGDLREHHLDEARFYALVSTLRFGCPPFRSAVFSLATGEWTEPDIDDRVLFATAEMVVQAVATSVAVLTEARPPTLTSGRHCLYCPAKDTCTAFAEWDEAGRPDPETEPVAHTARLLAGPGTPRIAGNKTQTEAPPLFDLAPTPQRRPAAKAPKPAAAPPEPAVVEPSGPNPWDLD